MSKLYLYLCIHITYTYITDTYIKYLLFNNKRNIRVIGHTKVNGMWFTFFFNFSNQVCSLLFASSVEGVLEFYNYLINIRLDIIIRMLFCLKITNAALFIFLNGDT